MTTEAETKTTDQNAEAKISAKEEEEKKEVETETHKKEEDNDNEVAVAPSSKKRTLDEATEGTAASEVRNGAGEKREEINGDKDTSNEKSEKEGSDEPVSKRKKVDEETKKDTSAAPSLFGSFQTSSAPSFENPFAAALKKASGDNDDTNAGTGKSIFGGSNASSTGLFSKSAAGFASTNTSGAASSSIFGSTGVSAGAFGSKTPFSASSATPSLLWGKSSGSLSNDSAGKDSTAATADISTTAAASNPSPTKVPATCIQSTTTESVSNGEENEVCILQFRAKLYRLVPVANEESSEWKEVGIGPLRLLKTTTNAANDSSPKKVDKSLSSTYRLVQRRECTPGGLGTKLILNVTIGKDVPCTISRQAEKYLRLATVCCSTEVEEKVPITDNKAKMEAESVTYLFKLKTVEEGNDLLNKINEALGSTSSDTDEDKSQSTKNVPVQEKKDEEEIAKDADK